MNKLLIVIILELQKFHQVRATFEVDKEGLRLESTQWLFLLIELGSWGYRLIKHAVIIHT